MRIAAISGIGRNDGFLRRLLIRGVEEHVRSWTVANPANKSVNLNPVAGISNYEYEVRVNDNKRLIYILKSEYLQLYLNELRRIMQYEKSSQYINRRLAATENTRNTSPK